MSATAATSNLDRIANYIGIWGTKLIPVALFRELYCMGDGFGALGEGALAINGGYDWSHIRDSSDEALAAISARIDEFENSGEQAIYLAARLDTEILTDAETVAMGRELAAAVLRSIPE